MIVREPATPQDALGEIVGGITDAQVAFHGPILRSDVVDASLTRALMAARSARGAMDELEGRVAHLLAFAEEWWARHADDPLDHENAVLFDMARTLLKSELDI